MHSAFLSYRDVDECLLSCRMLGIPRILRRYHWLTHLVGFPKKFMATVMQLCSFLRLCCQNNCCPLQYQSSLEVRLCLVYVCQAALYVPDSEWHNRDLFFKGRVAIRAFLEKKWEMELDYRLVKELW